jgi:predicted glycosyltransferase
MTPSRILFYVQHLLGIGHLRRAATLTRAFQAAGFEVTLVSGGRPLPDLDLGGAKLVQLAPLKAADARFSQLLDSDDRPVDEAWKARRRDVLLGIFRDAEPDALIVELFPFGRRQMRFELLPLLELAHSVPRPPVVISSVRDILVPPEKPERLVDIVQWANCYFDHVMIHGDPSLIPLEETFPKLHEIAGRVSYTGYVVDTSGVRRGPGQDGFDEVIVSAGGGAFGEQLLRCAMSARAASHLKDKTWRVLVGVSVAEEDFRSLCEAAPPGMVVERARGDFPDLLMSCAMSISQGGYNTVMEVLRAGCPAVVVPFAGGVETEQTIRANLLAGMGYLTVLPETELSPERMATAIDQTMTPAARKDLDVDGADKAVAMVELWVREREQPR